MRAHQLNEFGEILNTIRVESLNAPWLVDASIGGGIGDRIVDGVLIARPAVTTAPVVPASLARRQVSRVLSFFRKFNSCY